jgi:hypothetical protein
MIKKAVVTTFNQSGYDKYGSRMIQSFIQNWPTDITLYVYAEDCTVKESAANVVVKDLHATIPSLVAFKERWKNDPKAVGKLAIGPVDRKGKQPGIGFRWDAIRFSHKVYSVCHTGLTCDADVLFWMDADTVCHSPITHEFIDKMFSSNIGLGFLGRPNKFTECGLYAMNLKNEVTKNFLIEFQKAYDSGRLFSMQEWNDCWVFDIVRKEIKQNNPNWLWYDWSNGLISGEGHPLINSAWGAYLDHLKGERKTLGRSKPKDLKVQRTEKYWKS